MKSSNMKAIHLIPALLSACSTIVHVHAQSAPDFPVQVKATQNLRVDFQSSNLDVDPAGALLQREDLLDPPTVQGPKGSTATLTFMLFMVDQDVSTTSTTTTTTTTNGGRQQLLHFFQPNLSGGSEVLFADQDADNFTSVPAASYIPPTPAAGDGPHRYTLLLYSQSQDFQVPNSFQDFFATKNSVRVGWDMAGFAEAAGLGEPVAANWFRVQNGDGTGSPQSGDSTTSSTVTGGGGGQVGTTASGSGSTVSTSSVKTTFSIASTSSTPGSGASSSAGVNSGTATNDATPSLTIVTLSPTATTTTTGDTVSSSASSASATATATVATSASGAASAASASGANAPSGTTAAASSSSLSLGTSAASRVSVLRWSNLGLVATSLVLGLVTVTELVMW